MKTSEFFEFMNSSVCNFCAVDTIIDILERAGFVRLYELKCHWNLEPGGRYFVVKNDSAIFAFITADEPSAAPFAIIAAHSDSPTFRIKPNPEIVVASCSSSDSLMVKLNTEVYGGAIWDSWMDRPLGLAGRVILSGDSPLAVTSQVVRLSTPKLIIPRLAIHFNREVNKGVALSAQKDMLPLLGYVSAQLGGKEYIHRMLAEQLEVEPEAILDFDLLLYDLQGAEAVGADASWVNCGRLDDLAMVWCALQALLEAGPGETNRVMAVFDNEETGSGTRQGAHSPVLRNILRRIAIEANEEEFLSLIARSFFISADCAHAAHPNYLEKMDPVNHPCLGAGPVIKVNANCKYMTDAHSSAMFKQICRLVNVPFQEFVNHSDSPGGSTLGNILTSTLDINGVDMGISLLAMHSARETASLTDIDLTISAFTAFYRYY